MNNQTNNNCVNEQTNSQSSNQNNNIEAAAEHIVEGSNAGFNSNNSDIGASKTAQSRINSDAETSGKSAEHEFADSAVVLLQSAFEGCDMGLRSLRCIVKRCDNYELAEVLSKHITEYNRLNREIADAIYEKGATPKDAPTAMKAMAKMHIAVKGMMKNSTPCFAKMAFKGAEMGILDLNHLLNNQTAKYSEEVKGLAYRMLTIHTSLKDAVLRFL